MHSTAPQSRRREGQWRACPRPDYGENCYARFVLGPDGYDIEAMINEP